MQKFFCEILQRNCKKNNTKKSQTFLLNSPTGTGKNDTFLYLISELKKKYAKKKFVIVYPSNLSNEAKTKEYSNAKGNLIKYFDVTVKD